MAEQHEKALVSQIRFTGFTDPWEQRKVQDVADRFDNLRIPVAANLRVHGKTPYYGANGIQDYVDGFTHDGEFVLVAEDGANDLKNYPVKCVNGRIWVNNHAHVLQGKAGIADNSFLAFAISQSDIESLLVGGGRAKLNAETLMSIEFRLPCLQEQHQIGEYLTRLDHLITLHQRKYDKLCVLKKTMLDKMFPKGGSLYPEIRFAGFTDPWEQRKLGEVASGFEYGLNAAASDFDGEKKYLRITDIDDQTREFRTDDLSSPDINNPIDDRYLLKEGDILFARTGASVGKTYLYKASDGKTYYAGFLIRAHVSDEADAGFIFQSTLTERYKQFVLLTSQRSGQPGINAQEYSDLLLPLPSLMEQRRIGAFFDRLDSLITLHQRKLELLRNIKKSMLDKMFV